MLAFDRMAEVHMIKLKRIQYSPKIIKKFTIVSSFDKHPKMQIYNFPLDALLQTRPVEDDEVRRELREVQNDDYQLVAPRRVSSITSRFSEDSILFTDGFRFEDKTGFGGYQSDNFEPGLQLPEPSGVFTAELTVIFYALHYILALHGFRHTYIGVGGNKRVDRLAKSAALGESFLQVPPRTSDFFPFWPSLNTY
jgi:hypothetical protein